MFLVSAHPFHPTLPGIRRITFYGENHLPITILSLGVVSLAFMKLRHLALLNELIKSGLASDEFLIRHSFKMQKIEEDIVINATAHANAAVVADLDRERTQCRALEKKNQELEFENRRLEAAIETLVVFRDKRALL